MKKFHMNFLVAISTIIKFHRIFLHGLNNIYRNWLKFLFAQLCKHLSFANTAGTGEELRDSEELQKNNRGTQIN